MARRCDITGKGVQVGNHVSHANNKTKRRFMPNLQVTSLLSDVLGQLVKLRLTVNAIRTIEHNGGLDAYQDKTVRRPPRASDLVLLDGQPAIVSVTQPIIAMKSFASGERIGKIRPTRYTPAATIVAAWMRADTGVGPSIASGNHTCSGNWADLPTAPKNKPMPIAVSIVALITMPLASVIGPPVPALLNAIHMFGSDTLPR